MSFYKSTENIRKKEGVQDSSVSISVTLNELEMEARKSILNFEFQQV